MRLTDEQIGAGLRELRELPSERFAAELDAWAAEGFPSLKQIDEPQTRRRSGGRRNGGRVSTREKQRLRAAELLAGIAPFGQGPKRLSSRASSDCARPGQRRGSGLE